MQSNSIEHLISELLIFIKLVLIIIIITTTTTTIITMIIQGLKSIKSFWMLESLACNTSFS